MDECGAAPKVELFLPQKLKKANKLAWDNFKKQNSQCTVCSPPWYVSQHLPGVAPVPVLIGCSDVQSPRVNSDHWINWAHCYELEASGASCMSFHSKQCGLVPTIVSMFTVKLLRSVNIASIVEEAETETAAGMTCLSLLSC